MLDIDAAREGFKKEEISDVNFVRSDDNIADALTKKMSQKALMEMVGSGRLLVKPEQWKIRN